MPVMRASENGRKRPATETDESYHSNDGSPLVKKARLDIGSTLAEINYLHNPVVPRGEKDAFNYAHHEKMPSIVTNHPAFYNGQAKLTEVMNNLCQIVQVPDASREIKNLIKDAKATSQLKFGTQTRIATVGDTGAGKSSFINSVLGIPDLANARDSGSSCTQVITEYHDHPRRESCSAEVFFKPRASIDHDIESNVGICIRYVTKAKQQAVQTKQNMRGRKSSHKQKTNLKDTPEGEDDVDEDQYLTAHTFLMQLFSDTDKCLTSLPRFEAFLLRGVGIPQFTLKLKKHLLQDKLGKALQDSDCFAFKSNDIRQLRQTLKMFTEKALPGQASLWPVVDHVKIFLDSPLLRSGIILVDCPGLSDTNSTRRKATESKLKDCGMVLVVAEIARIIDDPNVARYLRVYTDMKGKDGVALIATKSDMVDSDPEAMTDAQSQQLIDSQQAIDDIHCGDLDEAQGRAAMKVAELRQKRVRSAIRNDIVIESIRERLPRLIKNSSRDLVIIPVSSTSHLQHVKMSQLLDDPTLSLEDDNIGKVRALLCMRAQQGRLQTLIRHLEISAPMAIGRMQLVIEKSPAVRSDAIVALIETHYRKSVDRVTEHRQSIKDAFERTIVRRIAEACADKDGPVVSKVKIMMEDFRTNWPAVTIGSVLRKHGDHVASRKGGLKERINLNQDLLLTLSEELDTLIDEFADQVHGIIETLRSSVNNSLEDIRAAMDRSVEMGGVDTTHLMSMLVLRQKDFDNKFSDTFEGMIADLRAARVEITSCGEGTPFVAAMDHAYKTVLHMRKCKGITIKRVESLKTLIYKAKSSKTERETPIEALQRDFSERLTVSNEARREDMLQTVFEVFKGYRLDLELNFANAGKDDNPALRARLAAALGPVIPNALAALKTELENARALEEWDAENSRRFGKYLNPPDPAEMAGDGDAPILHYAAAGSDGWDCGSVTDDGDESGGAEDDEDEDEVEDDDSGEDEDEDED